jgi:hypothetical protein
MTSRRVGLSSVGFTCVIVGEVIFGLGSVVRDIDERSHTINEEVKFCTREWDWELEPQVLYCTPHAHDLPAESYVIRSSYRLYLISMGF